MKTTEHHKNTSYPSVLIQSFDRASRSENNIMIIKFFSCMAIAVTVTVTVTVAVAEAVIINS